jgi:rhodanese-related sulfurtransferase
MIIYFYKISFIIFVFLIIVLYYQFSSKEANDKLNQEDNVLPIDVKSAFNMYMEDKAIFIDSRDKRFYKYERIEGALSYPALDFSIWNKHITKTIEKNKVLIVYCDTKLCGISYYTAKLILELGYNKVYNLEGGIDQWIEEGFPVQSSF